MSDHETEKAPTLSGGAFSAPEAVEPLGRGLPITEASKHMLALADLVKAGWPVKDVVKLRTGDKMPDDAGWTQHEATRDELRALVKRGHRDFGLQRHAVLDLDIDDPVLCGAFLEAAMLFVEAEGIGAPLVRRRDGVARVALVFAPDPFAGAGRKITLKLARQQGDRVERMKIEMLGAGQQVKLCGAHPETGTDYWSPDPVPAYETVGTLLADQRVRLMEMLRDLAGEMGFQTRMTTPGAAAEGSATGAAAQLGSASMLGPRADVERLVRALPNSAETFEGYDDAIPVCAAIAGASGGADWGRDLWFEWVEKAADRFPESPGMWAEARWNSFRKGTAVGWGHLVSLANEAGVGTVLAAGSFGVVGEGPDGELEDLGPKPGGVDWRRYPWPHVLAARDDEVGRALREPPSTVEQFLGRMVFDMASNLWRDRVSGVAIPPAALRQGYEARMADDLTRVEIVKPKKEGDEPGRKEVKEALDKRLLREPGLRRVAGTVYWPGAPELVVSDGALRYNLWRPAVWMLGQGVHEDRGLGPFMGLVDHLCNGVDDMMMGPRETRELLLDWMAVVACLPERKPGFGLLLTGGQGGGKSMLFSALGAMLGERNVSIIEPDEVMSQYNAWLRAKVVVVEEIRSDVGSFREARAVYMRLKPITSNKPDFVRVNEKFEKACAVRNLAAFVATSNDRGHALAIENDDRRFWIVDTGAPPLGPEVAAMTAAWLEDAGNAAALWRWFRARLADMEADGARLARIFGRAPETEAKQDTRHGTGWKLADDVVRTIEGAMDVLRATDGKGAEGWRALMTAQQVSEMLEAAGKEVSVQALGSILEAAGFPRWQGGRRIRAMGRHGPRAAVWILDRDRENELDAIPEDRVLAWLAHRDRERDTGGAFGVVG